jgi:predicted small secreted protein
LNIITINNIKGKKMKKILLISLALGYVFMTAGCSRTWSGIKQDTSEFILGTQEVIHEATAPVTMQSTQVNNTVPNTVNVTQNPTSQDLHPAIPTAR